MTRLAATVVVAGPDGAGKTTVASRLATDVLAPPVLHLHHRPGVLPARTRHEGPVTEPHAQQPYSPVASLLKLVYLFVDYHAGWWTRVRRVRRRGGSVLLERGWLDLAVDPRRYRLSRTRRTLRLLTRLVPRPDLTVILVADPPVLAARKQELPLWELDRQVDAWRRLVETEPSALIIEATTDIGDIVSAVRGRLVKRAAGGAAGPDR